MLRIDYRFSLTYSHLSPGGGAVTIDLQNGMGGSVSLMAGKLAAMNTPSATASCFFLTPFASGSIDLLFKLAGSWQEDGPGGGVSGTMSIFARAKCY